MEIILAVVVIAAVIFFGALISMGNERQRRAIDSLREQIVLWAMQDLRIKRERLARDIRVDDPLGWFDNIVLRAFGFNMHLHLVHTFDEPPCLLFTSKDGDANIIFSQFSPTKIRSLKHDKHNRLSQYENQNPLFSLPRNVTACEFTALNGGIVFDMELSLAWKGLTNQKLEQMDHIWIYKT